LRQKEKVAGKDITISAHRQIKTDEIMCQLFREFGYCVEDESCDTIHLDIAHEVWFYSMCGFSEKLYIFAKLKINRKHVYAVVILSIVKL